MLSVVASLTPFSDYNQSPRNMYQCQMGKQTMGTPCHAIQHRVETKTYRLQTPQTPLCRTERYRNYHMDEYPNGTNAIVAVLAYTGEGRWGARGASQAQAQCHAIAVCYSATSSTTSPLQPHRLCCA